MFNIVLEVKFQAFDKDGKPLADPSDTSARSRKRAVLKVLGIKAFKPLEWAAAQKECLKKVGPMRIAKKTTYRAHENKKPIAEARDTRADAKADIAKATTKAPEADKAPPSPARVPKQGDS